MSKTLRRKKSELTKKGGKIYRDTTCKNGAKCSICYAKRHRGQSQSKTPGSVKFKERINIKKMFI